MLNEIPEIGSKWRSRSNSDTPDYTVILIANTENCNRDYPVTVIYQGDNGKVWAKPLANFSDKMEEIKC